VTENSHDDVTVVLIRDHREVRALLDELAQTPGSADPKRHRNPVDRVTIDLVLHATAEEQFLYPAGRSTVDGARKLTLNTRRCGR
jgi:hemerythrin superfamily protein